MELNLQKQTVSINETIYDGVVEQPLECDVLLPDYCPDIQKILRCEVVPSLLLTAVNGDKLSVDGMAMAHLYYLDENGCIRHAEYKIPYTRVVELRCAPQNPSVCVAQSVDYFNCRAVSSRRLDMRGAVTMNVRVTGQTEEEVLVAAEGAGLQLCPDTAENACVLPRVMRQASVREEVELGYGKPAVGAVIRASASAQVTDYKAITGKLVTKGEITVKVIYQCEEDAKKLDVMEYALPLSQVIDLDGVDEDCSCSVWYEVCSLDVTPKANADGENRAFTVDISLNACASAYRRMQLDAVCDCYSTSYECKPTVRQVPLLRLIDTVDETCMYKETLDLPPDAGSIVDVWCTAGAPAVQIEEDCAVVSGKMTVCMFVCEANGEIAYYDQTREYSHRVALRGPYETLVFSPNASAGTAAFTMSGHEKLEVRCPVRVWGEVCSLYRRTVVCDVTVDETRAKTRRDNVLYLYYASEREPVWEIAKRYNTSVAAIRAGNQLEGDVLEGRRLLLIPMK